MNWHEPSSLAVPEAEGYPGPYPSRYEISHSARSRAAPDRIRTRFVGFKPSINSIFHHRRAS